MCLVRCVKIHSYSHLYVGFTDCYLQSRESFCYTFYSYSHTQWRLQRGPVRPRPPQLARYFWTVVVD
jgi:hypothetical protein